MEDSMLELIEVCRQKEFYCMHDNVDDIIESSLNSRLLSINLESQRLNKKKQEVKNVVGQPTKRETRIAKSLQSFRVIHKTISISLNNTSQFSLVHVIAPILPTEEPAYSPSMRYEHLSTIPETESDEVLESSAKNLLPIPSEYEVTFDDESECDVPVKDESSLVFTTFSNPLFDCNDDFTSSNDESLPDEDVPIEEFKFDFLEEFSGALLPTSVADEERIRREHAEYISLMERLFTINLCPRLMENFNAIVETLPKSPIQIEDSNSQRKEIDIFTSMDNLLPSGFESDDDLEGGIYVLEELLFDDSISLSENKLFYFYHQDDPSFPRPPPEPPDVFFDLEPDSGEEISAVMNNIEELFDDECFNPGGEINVFANDEDDDYFTFMFVIRIFLPYLIYSEVSPLLLSTRSEDTIFDPAQLRFSFPFALLMDELIQGSSQAKIYPTMIEVSHVRFDCPGPQELHILCLQLVWGNPYP
nr:hypothetical protein [Tanacetum cinerariifolium]